MSARTLILLLIFLAGCGPASRETESYSDLRTDPSGIVLSSPQKHRGGWGRSDCLLCHNVALNVHRNPGSPVDADAVAKAAQESGSQYCFNCHGNNGTN